MPYYVSPSGSNSNPGTIGAPWLTLAYAQTQIRALVAGMSADITVYLRGGMYTLASALAFTSLDSGTGGHTVIWQAYPGETPILSGGQTLSSWTLHDAGLNIWQAAASGITTRLLYVDGVRCTRARSTGGLPGGSVQTGTGYTTTGGVFSAYARPTDLEMVCRARWTESRLLVASVAGDTVTMVAPAFANNVAAPDPLAMPTWYENAYELLNVPGEFYLDRGADLFYYIPLAGQNMASVTAIAPVLAQLLSVTGASHLLFQEITFQHTTWDITSGASGYVSIFAGAYSADAGPYPAIWGDYPRIPAAVLVTGSDHVNFERCFFTKLGTVGLAIEGASSDCLPRGNTFYDLSTSAINISSPQEVFASPTTLRVIVENNYIHHCGQEFHDACGIYCWYGDSCIIRHNDVGHLPYTGIGNGWGWGQPSASPNVARNNTLNNNYLHDCMQIMGDGAGIYSNGVQVGGIITANFMRDANSSIYGGGLYLDDGTEWLTVTGNGMANNQAKDLFTHNNIGNTNVTGNYFTTYQDIAGPLNGQGGATLTNVSGNTIGPVPAPIVDAAGLQAAYLDLLGAPPVSSFATL